MSGNANGKYTGGYSQDQIKKLRNLEEVLNTTTTPTEHHV